MLATDGGGINQHIRKHVVAGETENEGGWGSTTSRKPDTSLSLTKPTVEKKGARLSWTNWPDDNWKPASPDINREKKPKETDRPKKIRSKDALLTL